MALVLGLNSGLIKRPFVSAGPPLIGDALVTWLDADDGATITEAGGNVSQWDDKSGNANHVSQTTGSLQPETGAASINGINTIRFVNEALENTAFAIGGDLTIIIVANVFEVNNSAESLISFDRVGNDFQLDAASSTDFRYRANGPTGQSTYSATNQEGLDNIYSFDLDVTAGNARLRINGGAATESSYTNDITGTHILRLAANRVGSNRLDVDIGEVLIYNTRISTSDFNKAGNYLANKWGISWTDIS